MLGDARPGVSATGGEMGLRGWRRAAVGLLSAVGALCWAGSAGAERAQPYIMTDLVAAAQQMAARKDFAGALKRLDEDLEAVPGDIVGRAVRGNVYIAIGDFPRAIADHDIALSMAPHEPSALINACWARALGAVELDRALSYCDEAVAGARTRAFAAYDTRAFLHYRRGELLAAQADYDAALRLHRRLASSLYGRGIVKLRLAQEADGRADLAAAEKIEPGIAERYAAWGVRP